MISIVIPCTDMAGRGVEMLADLLLSIRAQTYQDYEVVISDSMQEGSFELADKVQWVQGKPAMAANFNNALDHARGDIIKFMCQDDKFIEPDSLRKIADHFAGSPALCPHGYYLDYCNIGGEGNEWRCPTLPQWIACTSHNEGLENYDHVPYPHKSLEALRQGENTYGSPSAMAWRKNDLRFDENLTFLVDCEFYARMAERYGVPTFVDAPIYIRQWEGQVTRTSATGSVRLADANYVAEKYR